ncbi:MAG TPA: ATP-binding protein [Blastocatellia bacterium]|nr:ATP-binding protein [Blastocatellia bacterium]
MAKEYLRKVPVRLVNVPRTAEWLARNILLVGFLALLLLVGILGYWSRQSFNRLEQEIEAIRQTEVNHNRVVRSVAETAGKMKEAAIAVLGNAGSRYLSIPAQSNLEQLGDEMEARIESARKTTLAGTSEWKEFEDAYHKYWATLKSPTSGYWFEERDRMFRAIDSLDNLVLEEQKEDDRTVQELSQRENNRLAISTIAVLLVGVVVALLTFREIRRILKRLSGAYRESSEARDYLQSLLDSVVAGVAVIGKDGAVKTISESFRRLPGIEIGEPLGENYQIVFENNQSLSERIADELEQSAGETRYLGKFELGERRLFEVFASPLVIAGEQEGLILVFIDVTEAERAQSELRRNRALAAVGQMTAQIAHEIKNPLGSIRFASEVLKRQMRSDSRMEMETLEVIERSVDHLATIVAELSEFARPKELNRVELNLNDLLEGLVPMVADRLNEKGMEVRKSFTPDLPDGLYDKTELRKLFLNLIINAIDASPQGSVLELRTRVNGKREAVIEIEDHGTGMSKETIERLFEPFYTTKEKGTGLGMAIAKKIAELHRGDLSVRSKQGEGTTAIVRLPLS